MDSTNMNSAISPREVAESLSVDALIELIRTQPNHYIKNDRTYALYGFGYPIDNPIVYIKHGRHYDRGVDAEARNQRWAYEALQKMSQSEREGIHIPEIYRVVSLKTWTIIIMEFVPGKTLGDLEDDNRGYRDRLGGHYDKIEKALKLFLRLPVPEDASPGPYGGGLIRHPLFKDYQSTIEYPTVELLEMHLNKLATWFGADAPKLVLERKLHFIFSDLYSGNFMFTDRGDLYVIDFERANFLPLSFMTYAMIQWRGVCWLLKERFSLPEENLEVMRTVCTLLVMSTPKLGLPVG
ncbi:hypothetical protein ACJ41O_010072 [Fusarium nematophilum]